MLEMTRCLVFSFLLEGTFLNDKRKRGVRVLCFYVCLSCLSVLLVDLSLEAFSIYWVFKKKMSLFQPKEPTVNRVGTNILVEIQKAREMR